MTRVTVLTGGVGGAKLVLGLQTLLGGQNVTAIVNTGDDFVHLGLSVSPDLDTLLYTLAGKANETLGWGRAGETWNFMDALRSIGGPGWFNLGDGDLALHVLRNVWLAAGDGLTTVTARFAAAWSVTTTILPMTDDPVRTTVDTDEGQLGFQNYFVERRCEPVLTALRFEGIAAARPGPGVLAAIAEGEAVIVAPSNPYLSVDPILAVPGIRAALRTTRAPVIAVSPVMNGQAFKGPTAKIMRELGREVSSATVAEHYADILDGLVVDTRDPFDNERIAALHTDIAMPDLKSKVALAEHAVGFARELRDRD